LLLAAAWQAGDEVLLPARPPLPVRPSRHVFPDVLEFLAGLDGGSIDDPVGAAERLLVKRLGAEGGDHAERLRLLIRGARDLETSLTFWLVQLFNLGSVRFEQIYGVPAGVEAVSYLEEFDRPTLTRDEQERLKTALAGPDRASCIVTNRPSSPPGGFLNTPEAEIGIRVAGLEWMPMIASGDLGRAALSRGLEPQSFLKPSPVHMLAGLRRAMGDAAAPSVETAVELRDSQAAAAAWGRLDGATVALFEDAPKGHTSARAAMAILARHGIRARLNSFGIASGPAKAEALSAAGARVHAHLRNALDEALPGW
jgi:hypothetical protein